jgi:transposase
MERPSAHLYETGRMRRVYLRGHDNILKRLLIHAGGLNLGLLMRQLFGVGTPRALQGRALALFGCLWSLIRLPETLWNAVPTPRRPLIARSDSSVDRGDAASCVPARSAFTTGC